MARVCKAVMGSLAAISAVSYGAAFLAPSGAPTQPNLPSRASASASMGETSSTEGSWGGVPAMAIACGAAHIGLATALRSKTARKVSPNSGENQREARLFQQVFMDYTREYLKGPMYWVKEKEVGFGYVQDPENIGFKNGKMTNASLQWLKNWSSNELAFASLLCFGLGLYGNLMWNIYDPQWGKVDEGGAFNAAYILESFCLLPSFLLHLACFIQKRNGK